jgi:hypothetical protein
LFLKLSGDFLKELFKKVEIEKSIPEPADGRMIGERAGDREPGKPVVEGFLESGIAQSIPPLE